MRCLMRRPYWDERFCQRTLNLIEVAAAVVVRP